MITAMNQASCRPACVLFQVFESEHKRMAQRGFSVWQLHFAVASCNPILDLQFEKAQGIVLPDV